MPLLVIDIAQHIRHIDGGNRLPARVLGGRIADFVNGLTGLTGDQDEMRLRYADFVERVNRDKTMGAGRMAELIVEEFDLTEEGAER